jgi:carbon-monoxide dehydrogenase large subunit
MRNTHVGSPIERVEDLRLLRGRGRFVDDISLPGQLCAMVLRSAVPHGAIRRIDTSAALAMPGVHAVLIAADIGMRVPQIPCRLFPPPKVAPFEQPVIADRKVRYVGEPVALVVAESPAVAEDAFENIVVDIAALPGVASRAASLRNDVRLFDDQPSNLAVKYEVRKGDAAGAFAGAAYVRREQFAVHRHSAIPMEPRGVFAHWDAQAGRLIVQGASKVPFSSRRILSRTMGIDESLIDVLEGDTGGSFGVRGEFFPEDFLVPFAARKLGRPVKWVEDRREHFASTSHARDVGCDIEIACARDGTILGLRGAITVDIGAYVRTAGVITPRNVGQFLSGPYRVPNIDIDVRAQVSNKSPSGTYRGPGRYEADFFRERLFDIVAGELGIDRVEFRRRNLVATDELPYAMPAVSPTPNATALDSGDYRHVLDRCLAEAGWQEKQGLAGREIDGMYHGLGVGCFIEGGAAGPSENARIVLDTDGTATVFVGSSGVGQGAETALGQIAADALEIPFDRIRVKLGSTTYVTEGWGSYHSRSTVMGGSAILLAAAAVKEKLTAAAARVAQCDTAAVRIADGAVIAAGRPVPLSALASEDRSAECKFSNTHHTYSYGTHVAHVTVDPRSGRIAVLDYVAVEDAGRIVNPLVLHGQVIGAIVQGLGGTILEDLAYDADGQLLVGTFADYLLPLATDFPNVRGISLNLHPSPHNPLGAKGAGEGGIIPVGGVIANAVASALASFGVAPNALPLSPPRLWQMIRAATAPPPSLPTAAVEPAPRANPGST